MATKLDVNVGQSDIGKKIWSIHQKNEWTKVNNYKEAVCFSCLKSDAAAALVVDICGDCAGKRGRESILVPIKEVYHGLCYFCGTYKFHMEQINCRLCHPCHKHVAAIMTAYNKKGGLFGADPFWVKQRKKYGKDWKVMFSGNGGNPR